MTADLAGRSSGSVSGFMNMGAQAGGWFTAWLTPLIAKHYGWTASFLVAAALCLTGAVAWLFVDPKRTLEVTHSTADIPMAAHGLNEMFHPKPTRTQISPPKNLPGTLAICVSSHWS